MLELKGIERNIGEFRLCDVTFRVDEGDYFILLGPSGAGKSVLLETIAGLIRPTGGSISLNGKDISHAPIQNRKIGMVFQDHAIFPHMKVRQNLAFALHGLGKDVIKEKIDGISSRLGISGLLERYPSTLSGGELQRVALARTLVQEPAVLLLDEPLASMDTRLKSGVRGILRQIHRDGQTIIHVTHDFEEAIALGTRIAVMEGGRILQSGSPSEVFSHPRNSFVAHFIGIRNFIRVRLITENSDTYAECARGGTRFLIPEGNPGDTGHIMIRGEDIILSEHPLESSARNFTKGIVTELFPTSGGLDVSVEAGEIFHSLVTPSSAEILKLREGKEIWLTFKASAIKFIRE
jgi:molybdopterin-binding protein